MQRSDHFVQLVDDAQDPVEDSCFGTRAETGVRKHLGCLDGGDGGLPELDVDGHLAFGIKVPTRAWRRISRFRISGSASVETQNERETPIARRAVHVRSFLALSARRGHSPFLTVGAHHPEPALFGNGRPRHRVTGGRSPWLDEGLRPWRVDVGATGTDRRSPRRGALAPGPIFPPEPVFPHPPRVSIQRWMSTSRRIGVDDHGSGKGVDHGHVDVGAAGERR